MDINSTNQLVSDLGLAASLLSRGFDLRATSKDSSGRVSFLFELTDDLSRAINAYWSNTLDVKARTLAENTKMLKSIIYSERGSP